MNLELFIAKKIHFNKDGRKKVSPPAIRIATLGVALGLAIMIISVAIVVGFKHEVSGKVIGFSSHIQISGFSNNSSFETLPIGVSDSLQAALKQNPEILYIENFATKPGILKTDNEFLGIALKGVDKNYDWSFFEKNLLAGVPPHLSDSAISNEILISHYIANRLHLEAGDQILCYFIDDNIRARKFEITGIYQTNFTEYDKLFIIGDVRHVQKLNRWGTDQFSGIEVKLRDFSKLDEVTENLYFDLMNCTDRYGEHYFVRSVRELNPQLFNWLDLLDMNVWVILILMAVVAGFTMISGLLIIILERTNMIGILKALGATNYSIRKIFIYISIFLVGKGMIWGNIIGILLCLLQAHFKLIKLDPDVYYIPAVPIELNFGYILILNISCLVISLLMLIGPSYLVSLIRPAKSIKFE
ncbi:ABC transporter permease [Coprobacter fastidiosus]|jgi:lipoprotein-releasing system permease protein|uniref:ABC transporter permease n=2 Tax=Coprobacter fastidiosus TaxID=1099853 RepID=UPI001D69A898|nr:ABC transporter permease [Coprobacter fastidiosus]HJF43134.1 ABC transporter permease [Coprobacter fastidiosus]